MKYLWPVLVVLLFLSCEKEEDDEGLVSGETSSDTQALVGTWRTNCIDETNDEGYESSKVLENKINELTLERKITSFTAHGCLEADKGDHIKYMTTYTYSGSAINLTVQDFLFAMYDVDEVNFANADSECGYSDWALGIEKSVIDINDCWFDQSQGETFSIPVAVNGNIMNENNIFLFTKE